MIVDRAWMERNIGVDPTSTPIPTSTFAVRAAASPSASLNDLQREIIDFDSRGRRAELSWPSPRRPGSAGSSIFLGRRARPDAGRASARQAATSRCPAPTPSVVTWTMDEGHALSRVLTPEKIPRRLRSLHAQLCDAGKQMRRARRRSRPSGWERSGRRPSEQESPSSSNPNHICRRTPTSIFRPTAAAER